jgi:hypothetical protein
MTRHQNEQHPIEKLVDDVEFKQRNTTWPDAMVNASSVDELLFKGSPRMTKVQRAGVVIIGLAYIVVAVGLIILSGGNFIGVFIAIVGLFLGGKFLWNSIRKNDPRRTKGRRH